MSGGRRGGAEWFGPLWGLLRVTVAAAVLAALISVGGRAQETEPSETGIGKELRTLEVVLDNLLNWPGHEPFASPFGHSCRAIHLQGYGVLFYACRAMPYQSFGDMGRYGAVGDRARSDFNLYGQVAERPSPAAQLEENKIKSRLNEFFGNYVTGLTSLASGDRVSVMVKIEGPFAVRQTQPYIFASVEGRELEKLEGARNPVDEAGKRVEFRAADINDGGDKNLHIMAQILGANLEVEEVSAVYLDDFGVLFLADTGHFPLGLGFSDFDLFEGYESSGRTEEVRRTGPDSTVSFFQLYRQAVVGLRPDSVRLRQRTDRIKEVLVDALARYGRTLEKVKREDRLGLVVITQALMGAGPRGIQVYVDNADLIDYRRGRIDRNDLMERVGTTYF